MVERLDIKQKVFARVDEVRKPGSIISSNTSGLSIAGMTEGRSEDFKQHFLVTHFFNPVRYMRLLELVSGEETKPEILEFFTEFRTFPPRQGNRLRERHPNFIGNRIGTYGIAATFKAMMEMDYQVDEVDSITGPAMGHPSSASFGTVDLVGIDVLAHVTNTIFEGCPDDEQRDIFQVPDFIQKMIEAGSLGRKTKAKGGFYRMQKDAAGKKTKLVIDWKTGEYRPKERAEHSLAQKGQSDPRCQGAVSRRGLCGRPRRRLRVAADARHPRLLLDALRRDLGLHRRHRQCPPLGLQLGPRPVRGLGRARRRPGGGEDGRPRASNLRRG